MWKVINTYTPTSESSSEQYDEEADARRWYQACIDNCEPTSHVRLYHDDVLVEEADGVNMHREAENAETESTEENS